ncbi:hypothetical protein PYW08_004647 [Mythimna loreyi]|uniref:Uncharacterized protein n=1 Tax=Mythimna loreyi TaxID=667449 RepID=A0ACC2QS29_9NEOP|nr:hypothetical protein PYW08_004647 [Mythimna loreyi]
MENGDVTLEFPNAYYRWNKISPDQYCIDVDNREGSEPRFWAIPPSEEKFFSDGNKYLTIATVISCIFMLLVLVVYLILPELQNLGGLILMAYLFSLFMAFALLVVMQIPKLFNNNAVCIVVSSVVYYFFLAAFCWMSVMSFDMWSTFRIVKTSRQRRDWCRFLKYGLYAWGVPLLMTIFMVTANINRDNMKSVPWFITPRIPEKGCFLQGGAKFLYFYIPMLILIICNWIFFLMTAFHIRQSNVNSAMLDSAAAGLKLAHRDQKQKLMVYLKLSVVMGLSWLLEVISFVYHSNDIMWLLPDTYNSLIGLAMFLIFVCKKHIWHKLCKRCGLMKITHWSSKTTERSKIDSSQEEIPLQLRVSFQPNGLCSTVDELKEKTLRR